MHSVVKLRDYRQERNKCRNPVELLNGTDNGQQANEWSGPTSAW